MYHMILAPILCILGALYLVFAFVTPPPVLEPLFALSGRKLKAVVSFAPEQHQMLVGRLIMGGAFLAGGLTFLFR